VIGTALAPEAAAIGVLTALLSDGSLEIACSDSTPPISGPVTEDNALSELSSLPSGEGSLRGIVSGRNEVAMNVMKGWGALALIAFVVAPVWFVTQNTVGGWIFLCLGLIATRMAARQAQGRS
jgi:hypothetical protein